MTVGQDKNGYGFMANTPAKWRRRSKYGLAQKRRERLYGALDLGTNNCRLLIARPDGGGFRVVASFSRIVRLGEDVSRTGALIETAMARTVEALSVCAAKLNDLGVTRTRNIATEACRRAANCDTFLTRIKSETGLDFETITYEEEARLALLGCQSLLTGDAPYALVFDIGGGSTELTWARRKGTDSFEIIDVMSMPVGVVNLAEKCGCDVSAQHYTGMVDEIAARIPPFCTKNGIGRKVAAGEVQMVGTSGTVTTLGAVYLRLPQYSRARVDGLVIDFRSLDEASRYVAGLDFGGRAAIPCIGQERAELVVPGCAILDAICRTWPVGKLTVADRGLREGILMELMAADGCTVAGLPNNAPASPDALH
jgi:exopolyphosphatase/guanosine-5'-triphosphate,3'-diphosphate pyrophosphatase